MIHDYFPELDGPQGRLEGKRFVPGKGGGRSGGKGGVASTLIGSVAGFIAPVASSAVSGILGTSETVSTIIAGAGIGAAASAVTGGNALYGALGGAASSGLSNYFSSNSGTANIAPDSSYAPESVDYSNTSGMSGATAGVAEPSSGYIGVGSSPMAGAGAGLNTQGDTLASGLDGTSSGASSGLDLSNPSYNYSGNGTSASGTGSQSAGILGNVNWKEAGLKLGAQALGSLASSPGSAAMSSYLDDVKDMEQQAQNYNISQANKKSAVGDSLVQQANNIDPQYYGEQAWGKSMNQTAGQWADTEAKLRAQGYDDNYINAMKQKSDLNASQSAGTAYTSGYQSGQSAKNQTLTSAGQMYSQISQPTAGLSSAYDNLNKSNAAAQNGWGSAIESAFGIVDSNKKNAANQS